MRRQIKLVGIGTLLACAVASAVVLLAPRAARAVEEEQESVSATRAIPISEIQHVRRLALRLAGEPIADELPVEPCAGDMDFDGVVDANDISALLASFGDCAELTEDVNGDSTVNQVDMILVLANWGPCQEEAEEMVDPEIAIGQGHVFTLRTGSLSIADFEPQAECPCDITGDGMVDAADLAQVLTSLGLSAATMCPSDLTGDGTTDRLDLDAMVANWGECE